MSDRKTIPSAAECIALTTRLTRDSAEGLLEELTEAGLPLQDAAALIRRCSGSDFALMALWGVRGYAQGDFRTATAATLPPETPGRP